MGSMSAFSTHPSCYKARKLLAFALWTWILCGRFWWVLCFRTVEIGSTYYFWLCIIKNWHYARWKKPIDSSLKQHRTNCDATTANFVSRQIVKIEDLLNVDRDFCKKRMRNCRKPNKFKSLPTAEFRCLYQRVRLGIEKFIEVCHWIGQSFLKTEKNSARQKSRAQHKSSVEAHDWGQQCGSRWYIRGAPAEDASAQAEAY